MLAEIVGITIQEKAIWLMWQKLNTTHAIKHQRAERTFG